ncbi:MAG: hypothetical protein ACREB0_10675, partial [Sphingopyxis sp.]
MTRNIADSKRHIYKADLIGRIEGCTNPESAELLADGETIVFGNCTILLGIESYRAGRGITYAQGEAFISRARLAGRGDVPLLERRFIDGLTGTHGIDILPVATAKLTKGTAFITEAAGPQTVRGSGRILPKSAYQSNLAVFDPNAGILLGALPLGVGSAIAAKFSDLEQPNGLAFGANGDLYVSDMAPAAEVPGWDSVSPSAIYRIPHGAIDDLMAGKEGAADAVQRLLTPGKTNGLTRSWRDGSILSVSCSPNDPVAGGVYRYSLADFGSGQQPAPLIAGLGIIDGVGETRRGTFIASTPPTSEVHLFP